MKAERLMREPVTTTASTSALSCAEAPAGAAVWASAGKAALVAKPAMIVEARRRPRWFSMK